MDVALSAPTGGATLGTPEHGGAHHHRQRRAPPGTLQLSAATYSVAENGGTATITVTRTGGSAGAVGVTLTTSNGTATAPADYTAVTQTVSFAAGDTANKTVTIPIGDDALVEGNETVDVTLSAPTGGATLGTPSTAVLTITDNDVAPPGTLQLSAATYSVAENGGTATITITRTGGSGGAVGVTLATSNGTATAPADYTAVTPDGQLRGWRHGQQDRHHSDHRRRAGGRERDGECDGERAHGRGDARHAEHGGADHHR